MRGVVPGSRTAKRAAPAVLLIFSASAIGLVAGPDESLSSPRRTDLGERFVDGLWVESGRRMPAATAKADEVPFGTSAKLPVVSADSRVADNVAHTTNRPTRANVERFPPNDSPPTLRTHIGHYSIPEVWHKRDGNQHC